MEFEDHTVPTPAPRRPQPALPGPARRPAVDSSPALTSTVAPAPASLSWSVVVSGLQTVAIIGLVVWALTRGTAPSPAPPGPGPPPAPAPVLAYDPAFVPLGKAYAATLGPSHAAALGDGATALESGQSLDMALGVVATAFTANRQAAYDKIVSPALSAVIADGADEAKITTDQRTRYARALRGVAKGEKP